MGGAAADNDPAEVARGILTLSQGLTCADTGKFFTWHGQEREL
jgi:hypothetical protein